MTPQEFKKLYYALLLIVALLFLWLVVCFARVDPQWQHGISSPSRGFHHGR